MLRLSRASADGSSLTGGLLNREKTAFRRDTLRLGAPWSKHVRCPKALALSTVLRLQQTTAKSQDTVTPGKCALASRQRHASVTRVSHWKWKPVRTPSTHRHALAHRVA